MSSGDKPTIEEEREEFPNMCDCYDIVKKKNSNWPMMKRLAIIEEKAMNNSYYSVYEELGLYYWLCGWCWFYSLLT